MESSRPASSATKLAGIDDVKVLVDRSGEKAILAREAVLLGSGVEDEVASERTDDEEHGMRAAESAVVGD